jgi:ribonuclease HI
MVPEDLGTSVDLNVAVTAFTKAIITSYVDACPIRKGKGASYPQWYTPEIEALKHECSKAFNKKHEDWENFRQKRRDYKKAYRKAQRASWRDFCGSIECDSATARIHRILSKDRSDLVCALKLANNEYTRDEKSLLNCLLEVHYPNCQDPTDEEETVLFSPSLISSDLERKIDDIAKPEAIRWAIKSFKPFKSPGPDQIFPALLQEGLDIIVKPLSGIFKACLLLGYIPKTWREVKVIFIPKPGRTDYEDPKNHRGISLSSFVVKTLERLVDRFIRSRILVENPLCINQYAYQRGKSTMSAIHKLSNVVESAFNCGEHVVAVFLDIEGAFDKASFNSFRIAARKQGVDQFIINWIDNLLKNRTIAAEMHETVVRKTPVMGCPQGGVLSPLIWLLIANSLMVALKRAGFEAIGFADDFVIYIRGKFPNILFELMNKALRVVEEYNRLVGLSVNPSKVSAMLFTKTMVVQSVPITLEGEEIKLVDEVKYLGLVFDSKLNWQSHIQKRAKKACMILGQCRRAVSKTWGLNPKRTHWLYKAIVRPTIAYGSLVWWHRAAISSNSNKLNHVQRLALLSTTGAMSSTPTAALECLSGTAPLSLYLEGEARAECLRQHLWGHFNPQRANERGHDGIWNRMILESPFYLSPMDAMIPAIRIDKSYRVEHPARAEWENGFCPQADHIFYTDGSFMDGKAGSGVFSQDPETNVELSLGAYATVFQAEVLAILECVRLCSQIGLLQKSIAICSDSRAALQALESYRFESKIVLECYSALNVLGTDNQITLFWIPGHSGLEGNEVADELARNGSAKNFVGPEPCLPLPKSWSKMTINKWMHFAHCKSWQKVKTCRQSKVFLKKPLETPEAKRLLSLDRATLRKAVGVITGHFYFKSHFQKMGYLNDSLCERCYEDEDTAYHMICLCPIFANRRYKILGDYTLSENQCEKLSVQKILDFIKEIPIRNFLVA